MRFTTHSERMSHPQAGLIPTDLDHHLLHLLASLFNCSGSIFSVPLLMLEGYF